MKKKAIQLSLLIGILLLFLVCYLLLTAGGGDAAEEPTSGGMTYSLCHVDQKTVSQIAYTLNGTEYSYRLKEDATGWLWQEDTTLPLDNLYFANMVTACSALTSTVRLTNVTPAQLMDYGLGESATRVRFADETYGTQAFRLGIRNSFNGMVYFANENDLTTVYMVPAVTADAFLYTPYEMIQIPTLPTDITVSNLVSLTFTPPKQSNLLPMTYRYYVGGKAEGERDVWYLSHGEGEEVLLDAALGKQLSTALSTVAFSSLISYRADEQAAFGLGDPWVMTLDYKVTQNFEDQATGKVTYVDVDKSFTLYLGDVSDGGLCFATVADSPLTCTLMGTVFGELIRSAVPSTSP